MAAQRWHSQVTHCGSAGNGLGSPGYVWISFFTDWTFCVYGFSGLLGFVVTVWRMSARRKARKQVHSDVEATAAAAAGAETQPAAAMQACPVPKVSNACENALPPLVWAAAHQAAPPASVTPSIS